MKNTTPVSVLFPIALVTAGVLLFSSTASARPYASGLTNDGGTISFRLNEAADNVKVISNDGATTNDLGALAAGVHTFPLGITDVYRVEVFKVSAPGFTTPVTANRGAVLQISTDADPLRFNNPRGLAVNNNPASPHFGRVYVANSSSTTSPRVVGDGIYVLNSDMTDALGQGDTPLTGGLDFGQSATASPYRLTIGQDNNLYITDWSDATGSLYVTDPNVSAGSGQNVLGGPAGGPFPVTSSRIHGSIAGAVVEGSITTGDLKAYVLDEDMQIDPAATTANQRNSLWRHEIGGTLPGPFTLPTQIALHQNSFLRTVGNQTMDLVRATNGNFYISNYRSSGNEAGVWVVDTNNTVIWNSLSESRTLIGVANTNDLLRATGGLDVSPAADYLAVINIETNGIFVVPMINGLPNLTNRLLLTAFNVTPQGRDVAFDAAGNLYAVSSGQGMLRVFSPGGTATTITGSDGTFSILSPQSVRVVAIDAQGSEQGADPISFDITREGNTDAPLTVTYTLTGTAGNGIDYETNVLAATIPAGETNVVVVITPVDDALGEPSETVILTLVATAEYNTSFEIRASGTIVDDEPVVSIAVEDREGNESGPDPIVFNIWRTSGNPLLPLTVNYTLTGTAGNGVDYETNVLSATIPAGETNILVVITPIDDQEAEFAETVILTIVVSPDYTRDTPTNRRGIIGDNETPTLTITSTGINPYEPFGTNGNTFVITRRGETNGDVFIFIEFAGTATPGADFIGDNPQAVYLPVGVITTNLMISPIDDSEFEGDETVIATLAESGYVVGTPGSATVSIIDNECPPETVLFGDNLNGNSSADWTVRFGANNNISDYALEWAFDYSTLSIPAAPGSAGLDTMGLKVTVNKNDTVASSAGINLYPNGQTFSGDFALRFDLYINLGNSNRTEHTVAGINHSGSNTNRASQDPTNHVSTAGSDGIWFAIEAAAGNLRDYAAYTSTNPATAPPWIATRAATTLTNVITRPPYFAAGSPGNTNESPTKAWAQVEVSQIGNIVALKVNKRSILEVTNTYGFNSGNVMIGYNDQFGSRGSPFNFAIFDNVRVVRLGISIADIDVSGNTVQIDFTSSEGEQAGDFRIESTESLSAPMWSTETGATIVPNGSGFRATVTSMTNTKFFRVAK